MFTGQTKELFEKWYEKSGIPQSSEIEFYAGDSSGYMGIWLDNFYKLPFSMQQGVYLQFLREQGMEVEATIDTESASYIYEIYQKENYDNGDVSSFYGDKYYLLAPFVDNLPDHDTALKSAITKAGELLNERSGK